jgi:hypothetical protein
MAAPRAGNARAVKHRADSIESLDGELTGGFQLGLLDV